MKFFDYSGSRGYTVTPDVVEYEKHKMVKPVYDLIFGYDTIKELRIALDFQTKEITIDKIFMPMTNMNNLANSNMEIARDVNTSMANDHVSTIDIEATKWVVHTLGAKYEKADLQSVVTNKGPNLDSHKRTSYWSNGMNLRNCLMGHCSINWFIIPHKCQMILIQESLCSKQS